MNALMNGLSKPDRKETQLAVCKGLKETGVI
jgi:hypothetical protein